MFMPTRTLKKMFSSAGARPSSLSPIKIYLCDEKNDMVEWMQASAALYVLNQYNICFNQYNIGYL